ncbi:hypothetical protein PILCRDRAFT_820412 [Piloderma croceum F 1598]|uniref:Uncharacterized protein n=1 Tax=Piloderma croceum (strain F 1598) TaxID=765440 RepID=A0A0C3FCY2_PILCF|nr:hypothetical protein PILCRDRAFT_820412 [Piloderma croceum F 1598]
MAADLADGAGGDGESVVMLGGDGSETVFISVANDGSGGKGAIRRGLGRQYS